MKVFQLQSLLLAGCVLVVAFPGFLSIPKVSSTISPRSEDAMIPNPPLYGPYYDWRAPCPDDGECSFSILVSSLVYSYVPRFQCFCFKTEQPAEH